MLTETLNKGDYYIIFLGLYIIVLKPLPCILCMEYCEKLSNWSNGLVEEKAELQAKEINFYQDFCFHPKELCRLLDWELNTNNLNKIVNAVKYFHKLRLGFKYTQNEDTQDDISFSVLPKLVISKKNGVLTKINTTISTVLFRDLVNNELVLTLETFQGFLGFLKSQSSRKKLHENVYHTFIETLSALANNQTIIDRSTYISYPKEKHKKKNFFISFYVVLLFFFEQEYLSQFSFHGKEKLNFSLSANSFAINVGPKSNKKTITLYKG